VRVFDDGEIISEIIPELGLLQRHGFRLSGPNEAHTEDQLTVAGKEE
jgi:hypothetical protein